MADYKLNLTGNIIQKKLDVAPYAETTVVEILPQTSFGADTMSGTGWALSSPLLKSLEADKEYVVKHNGKEYTCTAFEVAYGDGMNVVCIGNGSELGDYGADVPFLLIEYPKTIGESEGVYGEIGSLDGSTYTTISIKAVEETIHKLPSKYVEGSGSTSKYQQPEWGAETATVDILPEAEYTIMSEEEPISVITSPVSHALVVGDTYEVIYNGTSYNCTCVCDDSGSYALGNMGAAGGDYPNTGEPFMIGFFGEELAAENGFYAMIAPLDGSTTFTLSIKGEGEVIHAIPAQYVGNIMRVTVAHDMTADKTFDEIAAAINSGAFVYVFCDLFNNLTDNGYVVFTLVQFTDGVGMTFYNGSLLRLLTFASDGTIEISGVG